MKMILFALKMPMGVCDFKAFLEEEKCDVQKVQFFMRDVRGRLELMKTIEETFVDVVVSSALPQNVEINQSLANKGEALSALAEHLGISIEQTVAFGDGLNDLSMIRKAGIGIAMKNGVEETKAAADWMAPSCDEDGVALGIEKFCLGR